MGVTMDDLNALENVGVKYVSKDDLFYNLPTEEWLHLQETFELGFFLQVGNQTCSKFKNVKVACKCNHDSLRVN